MTARCGLLDAFAGRLGLAAPDVPWLTARDGVAEFIWLLAAISATVGKIGNEVYQLQRPEIGELRETFTPGTVGSITMPHKRNPEISEHLVTLSRVVRAQAGLALEGMVAEHERDGRAWKTEWLVVPEAAMYFAACVALGARMLDGPARGRRRGCARNIDAHRGYLLSEPVMRALAGRVGKHTAHETVYAAAMNGIDPRQDFRTALRADSRLDAISDAELDELLDVRASLGSCAAFVDRVRRACAGGGRVTHGGRRGGAEPRTPLPRVAAGAGADAAAPRAAAVGGAGRAGPAEARRPGRRSASAATSCAGWSTSSPTLLGQGCDCLVTGAGPQSNWTMLAALACLRYRIEPHVVCYGSSGRRTRATCGCTAGSGRTCGSPATRTGPRWTPGIEAVTAELRAAGRRPYPVPRGGATPLGALGLRAGERRAGRPAGRGSASGRRGCGSRPGRAARRPAWSRARR